MLSTSLTSGWARLISVNHPSRLLRLGALLELLELRSAPDEAGVEQEALCEPLGLGPLFGRQVADDVQARDDLGGARRASQRVGAQQRQDQSVELLGDAFDERARGRGGRFPELVELVDLSRRVGVPLGEHPEGQRAEGIKVAALVERRALES